MWGCCGRAFKIYNSVCRSCRTSRSSRSSKSSRMCLIAQRGGDGGGDGSAKAAALPSSSHLLLFVTRALAAALTRLANCRRFVSCMAGWACGPSSAMCQARRAMRFNFHTLQNVPCPNACRCSHKTSQSRKIGRSLSSFFSCCCWVAIMVLSWLVVSQQQVISE